MLGCSGYEVVIPVAKRPFFLKSDSIHVSVIDGSVEGISFSTRASEQAEVIKQLTDKFGQPTTIQREVATNRLGAAFQYVDAAWKLGSAEIEFEGIGSDIETGIVISHTPKLLKYLSEQKRMNEQSAPHL